MATLRAALAEIFGAADATSNANMSDVVGRKDDAAVVAVGTTKSIIAYLKGILTNLNLTKTEVSKIDDAASDGLSAIANSLGYKIAYLYAHGFSPDKWYGHYYDDLTRGHLSEIIIDSENDFYPEEKIIYTGSGLDDDKYELTKLQVNAITTVDRVIFMEFYDNSTIAGSTVTTNATTDTLGKTSHGLVDGTKIYLTDIVNSTGIDEKTIYYVVNKTANDFQVSLTLGGAAVDITLANGTCAYVVIGQTLLTETYISRLDTRPDTFVVPLGSALGLTTRKLSCRAKSFGGTNQVKFFLALKTY